jgi:hypothetical protein
MLQISSLPLSEAIDCEVFEEAFDQRANGVRNLIDRLDTNGS